MNGRNAKALRKAFNAKEFPEEYKRYKRALRHSEPEVRKKALETARKIAKGGKIHRGRFSDYARN